MKDRGLVGISPLSNKKGNQMIIQKSKVKKIFNANGVQLGAGAIESINREIIKTITRMANKCKEGNVKRILPDNFWIALGDYDLYGKDY